MTTGYRSVTTTVLYSIAIKLLLCRPGVETPPRSRYALRNSSTDFRSERHHYFVQYVVLHSRFCCATCALNLRPSYSRSDTLSQIPRNREMSISADTRLPLAYLNKREYYLVAPRTLSESTLMSFNLVSFLMGVLTSH